MVCVCLHFQLCCAIPMPQVMCSQRNILLALTMKDHLLNAWLNLRQPIQESSYIYFIIADCSQVLQKYVSAFSRKKIHHLIVCFSMAILSRCGSMIITLRSTLMLAIQYMAKVTTKVKALAIIIISAASCFSFLDIRDTALLVIIGIIFVSQVLTT